MLSRIHPIFHRERLYLYRDPQELFTSRTQHEQPPMDPLTEEYELDRILDKRKHYGKIQYLVQWKGYGKEDRTWEPLTNLTNSRESIEDFEKKLKSRGDVTKQASLSVIDLSKDLRRGRSKTSIVPEGSKEKYKRKF